MSIQKTLGGDRLGAGKKIKVDMHGWGRSTFNQSRVWRSTMAPGVLTPCFTEVGLNGTTFEIDINTLGHTLPTIAPLFGTFKLQVDFFACPIRLYQGLLHNNMLEIGLNMNKVLLPTIEIEQKIKENIYIPEATCTSSLVNYMGIKGITLEKKEFNAIPIIAYYDIFKNYYCNKQEENAKVISSEEKEKLYMPRVEAEIEKDFYVTLNLTSTPPNNTNHYLFDVSQFEESGLTPLKVSGQSFTKRFEFKFNENIRDLNSLGLIYNVTMGDYPVSFPVNINNKLFDENGEAILWFEQEGMKIYMGYYTIKDNVLTLNYKENLQISMDGGSTYLDIDLQGIIFNNAKLDIKIIDFPTSNLDDARKKILSKTNYLQKISISEKGDLNFVPYVINAQNGTIPLKSKELNGLMLKTYQNDIFNTWLSTEYVETINNLSSISPNPTTGEITIDAIILAKKVYNVLNRIAISGGTYEDWQESVYGEQAITRQESPLYIGGTSAEITFEEVVSTSQSSMDGVNQPLATLGGKGVMTDRKGGRVIYKCNEPCFIIGIASITPRVDYHQGNKWFMTDIFSMDNFHKPEFDGIGFQNLIANNVHWATSPNVGLAKQTAWINYQTAVNEVFGYFAKEQEEDENSLAFMTLRRNYEVTNKDDKDNGEDLIDFTSYIDPSKFNYAFAEPSLTAQNFWIQLGFNVESRRKMAAYEIPNL